MGLSMNDGIQVMFIFFHKTGSNFLHFPLDPRIEVCPSFTFQSRLCLESIGYISSPITQGFITG